jgi:hypothetical protein
MLIDTFLVIAELQRNGKASLVNDTVQQILGRQPRTVESFARDYSQLFK